MLKIVEAIVSRFEWPANIFGIGQTGVIHRLKFPVRSTKFWVFMDHMGLFGTLLGLHYRCDELHL